MCYPTHLLYKNILSKNYFILVCVIQHENMLSNTFSIREFFIRQIFYTSMCYPTIYLYKNCNIIFYTGIHYPTLFIYENMLSDKVFVRKYIIQHIISTKMCYPKIFFIQHIFYTQFLY